MHTAETRNLSASLEDYLEAIYHISESKQAARAKDISDRLGVNKSSVTGALKSLSSKGLVNYAPYDIITLTPEGKARAEQIALQHEVFRKFLVEVLGIEEPEAESNACRVEHALTAEVLERLRRFMEFLEHTPCGPREFVNRFRQYLEDERKKR